MARAKAVRLAARAVTPCHKCPLRRLKWYRDFTGQELQFIASFKSGERKVQAGGIILSEHENSANLYTVLTGWTLKYKSVEDGRRQVTNYGLPGDLLGLQASVFDAMHHSVEALTDVTLCILPRDKLWTLYEQFAGLAFDMTWLGAGRINPRRIPALGRTTAGFGATSVYFARPFFKSSSRWPNS